MSGGKGGSTTSKTEIPPWMEQAAQYALGRAKVADKIGYQPYYGPDIAAFSPMQEQAFQGTMDAAAAFGMAPQQTYKNPMADIKQDFGGVQGYSSGPLFDQAVAEYESKRPRQAAQYNQLFVQDVRQPVGQPATPSRDVGMNNSDVPPRARPSGAANIMPQMQQYQGYQAPNYGTSTMDSEAMGYGGWYGPTAPAAPATPSYADYFATPMATDYSTPEVQATPKKLGGTAKAKRRADLARR